MYTHTFKYCQQIGNVFLDATSFFLEIMWVWPPMTNDL